MRLRLERLIVLLLVGALLPGLVLEKAAATDSAHIVPCALVVGLSPMKVVGAKAAFQECVVRAVTGDWTGSGYASVGGPLGLDSSGWYG